MTFIRGSDLSWGLRDIPDLTGRTAVVTGASGGLRLETARGLAAAGAQVVVAARDPAKGRAAAEAVGRDARFEALDLADLASVQAFAERVDDGAAGLDLLVNNAGVMAPPERRTTRDGFELQLGTNHLGHFALTGRLVPMLRRAAAPRVVTVASLAARAGAMDFGNLNWGRNYSAWRAYGRSKLANLLFTRELARRSANGGWGITAVAAHPGWSRTELTRPRDGERANPLFAPMTLLSPLFSQDAAAGALPTLRAAVDPQAEPGAFYGPGGRGELKGPPVRVEACAAARSDADAARLWTESERLTGVSY